MWNHREKRKQNLNNIANLNTFCFLSPSLSNPNCFLSFSKTFKTNLVFSNLFQNMDFTLVLILKCASETVY